MTRAPAAPSAPTRAPSPSWRSLRLGPLSARWHPRHVAVAGALVVLGVALVVAGVAAGDLRLPAGRVLAVLLGGGEAAERVVVLGLRLPRTLLAVLVGALLALSGALVQTTTRNGLASPDLLGVTGGAGAAATAVLVLGGGAARGLGGLDLLGGLAVPVAALAGGLAAAVLVALVLRVTGAAGLQPLLVGVAVAALMGGLTSWMLVAADLEDAERASAWLAGSLGGRGWAEVLTAGVTLALVAPWLPLVATRLLALELGAATASSLGQDVRRSAAGVVLAAVALASVAAAVAGPIAFVALVAPHLARMACRAPRPPLAVTALTGAVLLLLSDLAARTVAAPVLLPTGLVTALVGAPFLVWLLVRSRRAGMW
ncbi:FecCD family ABC transporter permease [Pseudokineococcus sp. 1T1Z-3]|uniref:FecCD family ABC transporter permease n=1 Tax=Pseudokineococcus sp. 1T1Z-3 TaxID=3132745 RepID=UPI0030A5CC98